MVTVNYKEPFDLELEDEGVFRGKRYKISKIEISSFGCVNLTLYNKYETMHNVLGVDFAVRIPRPPVADKIQVNEACEEWLRGCSCADKNKPEDCKECTEAFLNRIKHLYFYDLIIENMSEYCDESRANLATYGDIFKG